MKTRDNMSAVIEGLQREHGLEAAYLEATDISAVRHGCRQGAES
jgi:hypothetical protein